MKIYFLLNLVSLCVSSRDFPSKAVIINESNGKGKYKELGSSVTEKQISTSPQTTADTFPWQVSLQLYSIPFGWAHICGGAIISNRWIITSAHCVKRGSRYRIIAGTSNYKRNQGTAVEISKFTKYPSYSGNGPGFPNDIAMLLLNEALTFTPNIKAVKVPDDQDFIGKNCSISGWGRSTAGITPLDDLQYVEMPVIDNNDCRKRWRSVYGATIADEHICVFQETKSACSGDSGGPLTCYIDETAYLAGLTSWGMSSCTGDFPSVFTRVSHFKYWIKETMAIIS